MISTPSARVTRARSYLFVPGDRPDRFRKAFDAGADAVILDLEDSVSSNRKSAARDAIDNFVAADSHAIVRINALDTEWAAADIDLCRRPGISAVMIPKAQSASDVTDVAARVGGNVAILALIETAKGMANAHAISQTAATGRLVFGTIDFQLDLGIDGDDWELLYFRSLLVLASRCAGLPPPCDGVTASIDDDMAVATDARRSQRIGFGAKLCIHPRQVPLINRVFTPDVDARAWAQRVLDASASAGGSAVALDGKMIDRPVVERAQRIIDAAHIEKP
ncbi:HpcH/HpaI aldolase/citrate lyase family protein [Paraburkholderia sp. GAS32]|jgi:citrate lyase subunit beta/citryl-CoA lyase|uniref:HpcH/HpaI aldolase/citrate lyase family protein n=1 Tax=Paraburkholderia sp. GAS32 TaxID=3035129 RepID=UPI003D1EB925